MDKMLSVHQKKTNKQPKSKKKPVKVVYISNPMKVKTSASQFRALVQELTGQDADMSDPTKFQEAESVGGGGGSSQEEGSTEPKGAGEVGDHQQLKAPQVLPPRNEIIEKRSEHGLCEAFDDDYDEEDDVFTPQMAENFSGLVASNLWYESTHFDELKSLDLV